MTSLQVAKKELRRRIKQLLSEISAESIKSQTALAVKSLYSLPQYRDAKRISIYLSMPNGEISTSAIVQDALSGGKRVFIPYYYKLQHPAEGQPASVMDMLELQSLQDYQSFQPDKWGIPTPPAASVDGRKNSFGSLGISEGKPSSESESGLDLIVMPGMAFDRSLGRLGHGKGFYDFFLTRTKRQSEDSRTAMPFLVGLALEEQLLSDGDSVPMDTNDWRLDALIIGDGSVVRPDSDIL